MTAAPLAGDNARHPLTWPASAAFGALWVVAYIGASQLVELALRRPMSPGFSTLAWILGVGIPAATLLFRYVSVWTLRGESTRSSTVWIVAVASVVPYVWPFEGARSVAHALAAAAVTFAVFHAASRRYT
jgi:hypothetical protein